MHPRTLIIILAVATAILGGCSKGRELPSDANDGLKLSPCACIDLNYQHKGYTWQS